MLTLYKQPLPEATTDQNRDELGTVLSEQGVLDGDALVEAISSEAADLSLTGSYAAGDWAPLLAGELEELADASMGALPLFGTGGASDLDSGYYEVESADVGPPHAVGKRVYEWDLTLTKKGTRKSHLRAVETEVTQPSPGHEFGNDTDALVGIPTAATAVRVVDTLSQPTQRASTAPIDTVDTPHGSIDVYDVNAEAIDTPIYIYRVAYDEEAPVDVRVYDTLGRDGQYIEGSDGRVRQWQGVYARDHDFAGAVVIENGLLRVTIDEPTNADATAALEAETYDAGADSWSTVSLPSYADGDLDTDWQPADVDLTHIGQARVAAQVEFEAVAGTNAGDVFAVDVELERGRESLEVWIPERVTAEIPTDLEALLDPIASTSVVDTGVEQGLVAREEVRR
ncbi:hypothetical protein [Halorubrum ezzemoulense]|uniref:Uncharacterized protein n=1 Tax=Halorubrum ezzemoulense TaxID=337243 RepID=A0A256JV41_HALEZ|nr:hypothetical protein [Halorubrum ezzemoulense]OYR72708.1 hypothetical protein DJ78_01975 [Halorubrum ezzemoulense]